MTATRSILIVLFLLITCTVINTQPISRNLYSPTILRPWIKNNNPISPNVKYFPFHFPQYSYNSNLRNFDLFGGGGGLSQLTKTGLNAMGIGVQSTLIPSVGGTFNFIGSLMRIFGIGSGSNYPRAPIDLLGFLGGTKAGFGSYLLRALGILPKIQFQPMGQFKSLLNGHLIQGFLWNNIVTVLNNLGLDSSSANVELLLQSKAILSMLCKLANEQNGGAFLQTPYGLGSGQYEGGRLSNEFAQEAGQYDATNKYNLYANANYESYGMQPAIPPPQQQGTDYVTANEASFSPNAANNLLEQSMSEYGSEAATASEMASISQNVGEITQSIAAPLQGTTQFGTNTIGSTCNPVVSIPTQQIGK